MRKKPYYGYNAMKYFFIALIAGGIVSIILAIIFTASTDAAATWVLTLCRVLGLALPAFGTFFYLSWGCMHSPEKMRLFHDNFLNQLRAVWDGRGKVLDIGTGNGRAAIEIAKMSPEAEVVGVDTWARMWEYLGINKNRAEENAVIEGVDARCKFQDGDASHLPFGDGEFQLVVSILAFHEVHTSDRMILLREVIRVLSPDGCFMICDCLNSHYLKGYYAKDTAEFLEKIEQLGAEDVKCKGLKEAGFDPGGLFHLWGTAYLSGKKILRKSGEFS